MAKKKATAVVRALGVDGVLVGPCHDGQVHVTAYVTFPSKAEEEEVWVSIVNAATGGPLTPWEPMSDVGGGEYAAGPIMVTTGQLKAKVKATWKIPSSHTLLSAAFAGCDPVIPGPLEAARRADCCE